MNEFILSVIYVALIAAFILILMKKWGLIEHVQVHGNEFFSKMFHCDFCLSFWVSVLLSFFMAAITGDAKLLFIPLLSTPVTRVLL